MEHGSDSLSRADRSLAKRSLAANGNAGSMSDALGLWEPKRSITLASARNHTRNILILRKLLFLVSIGFAAFVIWSLAPEKSSELSTTALNTDSARMKNPRYNGRTGDGQPYKLTADTAIRPNYDSNEVTLAKPIMEFFRQEGADKSYISAQLGQYDDVAQVLELHNDVILKTDDGNNCKTHHAKISTQDKTISGDKPIKCQGGFGEISAGSFLITDNYSTFSFSGGMTGEIINNSRLNDNRQALSNKSKSASE